MASGLHMTVTNASGIKQIELREALNQAVVNVDAVVTSHSLSIGDTVDVAMGTSGAYSTVMAGGIVRKILTRVPEYDYTITIQDKLCRAVDYFIASDDPNNPYKANNIKAEDLVTYLLGLAGLSVTASSTIFTYGTASPVPINTISVWEMVSTISNVCGFTTYCTAAGSIFFAERKPYITASDTTASRSYATGNSGDILSVEYDRNTEALRNRVVVYGGNNNTIYSTAQASSAYLPVGFYKTMVIGHPLIDSQAAADSTASLNLDIFNRLTETVNLESFGNSSVRIRDIVDVAEGFTGLTAATKWLVYGQTMTISQAGFVQRLTLVR